MNSSGESEILIFEDETKFKNYLETNHRPAVLRNANLGPCLDLWKDDKYLQEKLSGHMVRAHVGQNKNLDFRTKNFSYCDIDLGVLVDRARKEMNEEHFFAPDEIYYLRSVSGDGRTPQVSNLSTDYPQISQDFHHPKVFAEEQMFSSVLRISSAGVRIWTHYDVTDNVYCQVVGHKTAVLWPPWQADNLYLQGDKSLVTDIDNPGPEFPLFPTHNRLSVDLQPADVLFIPALWFHNMKAKDFGVAVNVFWKELENKFYDPKDSYGNKDLVPGAKALAMLDNVIKQLKLLPPELYTYVKENNTKMPFPLVCYDVASGSESETEDCKDDIKPVVIPVEYSPSEVVSCILEELMDKVLFGGATDFSDMYIKEEPVVYDSEEMEDAGFDTQEYRQDVKIEINSDDSDVESIDGGEELEDNSKGSKDPPRTKNELRLCDLPPVKEVDASVNESEVTKIGIVSSCVNELVVVESLPGNPAIDIDSVLFLDQGQRALGQVFDVIGPVAQPYYCVRFNSREHIDSKAITNGMDVYYAPKNDTFTSYVFLEQLMRLKISDASWRDDEEPPPQFLDYSDDEEERAAKKEIVITKMVKAGASEEEVARKRARLHGGNRDQSNNRRDQSNNRRNGNPRTGGVNNLNHNGADNYDNGNMHFNDQRHDNGIYSRQMNPFYRQQRNYNPRDQGPITWGSFNPSPSTSSHQQNLQQRNPWSQNIKSEQNYNSGRPYSPAMSTYSTPPPAPTPPPPGHYDYQPSSSYSSHSASSSGYADMQRNTFSPAFTTNMQRNVQPPPLFSPAPPPARQFDYQPSGSGYSPHSQNNASSSLGYADMQRNTYSPAFTNRNVPPQPQFSQPPPMFMSRGPPPPPQHQSPQQQHDYQQRQQQPSPWERDQPRNFY